MKQLECFENVDLQEKQNAAQNWINSLIKGDKMETALATPNQSGFTPIAEQPVYAKDWLIRGGANYEVGLEYIYTRSGMDIIEKKMAIVRKDTRQALGIATRKYKVFNNLDSLSILDPLVSDGQIVYTGAGSYDGGEVAWIEARIGQYEIAGDIVDMTFRLLNFFTGKRAYLGTALPRRRVCLNGLMLPIGKGQSWSIRHTTNADARFKLAQVAMDEAGRSFREMKVFGDALAKKLLPSYNVILDRIFPHPHGEFSKNVDRIRDSVRYLADHGRGNANHRGTAWALYNGITDYVDHEMRISKGSDREFMATVGRGAEIKRRAAKILQEA